jgi:hypothetical protein
VFCIYSVANPQCLPNMNHLNLYRAIFDQNQYLDPNCDPNEDGLLKKTRAFAQRLHL